MSRAIERERNARAERKALPRDYNLANVTHIVMGGIRVPVIHRGQDTVIGPWRYAHLPDGAHWTSAHITVGRTKVALARFPVRGAVLIRAPIGARR